MLAVIQVGKLDIASSYLPAVIRSDDFLCSIFVSQAQLGNMSKDVAENYNIFAKNSFARSVLGALKKSFGLPFS